MAVMSVLVGKQRLDANFVFELSIHFSLLWCGPFLIRCTELFFFFLLFVACAQDLQCGILKDNMHDIGSSISAIHDYVRPDYGAFCV